MEDKIFISKITHITIITMNPEVGEGFWKTTQTTLTDYRGRMADMEDIREVESFRGAVIPVKSP